MLRCWWKEWVVLYASSANSKAAVMINATIHSRFGFKLMLAFVLGTANSVVGRATLAWFCWLRDLSPFSRCCFAAGACVKTAADGPNGRKGEEKLDAIGEALMRNQMMFFRNGRRERERKFLQLIKFVIITQKSSRRRKSWKFHGIRRGRRGKFSQVTKVIIIHRPS